jgi:hypothetical protein
MDLAAMDLAPPPTWRLHIPSGILTTGPIITVVLIIAMAWNEPDQYASTITEATSWRILFDSAGTGVIIAAALSAWIAPRLASVTQAIGLQPWVAQPVDHPVYTFFIWLRQYSLPSMSCSRCANDPWPRGPRVRPDCRSTWRCWTRQLCAGCRRAAPGRRRRRTGGVDAPAGRDHLVRCPYRPGLGHRDLTRRLRRLGRDAGG